MKWILRITGIIFLVPFIIALYWYFSSFYPYLSELKLMVKNEEKVVSRISDIQNLAVIAESRDGIRSYALRQAYRELVFDKKPQKPLYWHLNSAIWYFSSYLHFNDNEVFYLWSSLVYSGRMGLQNSSIYIFDKELSKLNFKQKAELVAMVKAPSRLKLGSDALKKRLEITFGIK